MSHDTGIVYENWLQLDGLRQRVWLICPPGKGPFPCLIWVHGSEIRLNSDGSLNDRSQEPQIRHDAPPWRRLAVRAKTCILIPETRGYGGSSGMKLQNVMNDPRNLLLYLAERAQDVEAALKWAVKQPEISKNQCVLAGSSHGAIVALIASARFQVCGTISLAPGIYYGRYDVGLTPLRRTVASGKNPVLFQHLRSDSLCSFTLSKDLYNTALNTGRQAILKEYPGHSNTEGHHIFLKQHRKQWIPDFINFTRSCFEKTHTISKDFTSC